jgi:hypothetical protein
MIKIGNIVTFGATKINLEGFHIHEDIHFDDKGLPTLYVGFDQIESHLSDVYELDFINRRLSKNKFWTMSRVEDRYMFNRDLEAFMLHCEDELLVNYAYQFINPLDRSTLKTIFSIIHHIVDRKAQVYMCDKMVYFQSNTIIFGFNTEFGEICGIPHERVLKFINDYNLPISPESTLDEVRIQFRELNLNTSQLLFIKEKFTVS